LLSDAYAALEVMIANGRQSWYIYRGWLKKGCYGYYWDGSTAPACNDIGRCTVINIRPGFCANF